MTIDFNFLVRSQYQAPRGIIPLYAYPYVQALFEMLDNVGVNPGVVEYKTEVHREAFLLLKRYAAVAQKNSPTVSWWHALPVEEYDFFIDKMRGGIRSLPKFWAEYEEPPTAGTGAEKLWLEKITPVLDAIQEQVYVAFGLPFRTVSSGYDLRSFRERSSEKAKAFQVGFGSGLATFIGSSIGIVPFVDQGALPSLLAWGAGITMGVGYYKGVFSVKQLKQMMVNRKVGKPDKTEEFKQHLVQYLIQNNDIVLKFGEE